METGGKAKLRSNPVCKAQLYSWVEFSKTKKFFQNEKDSSASSLLHWCPFLFHHCSLPFIIDIQGIYYLKQNTKESSGKHMSNVSKLLQTISLIHSVLVHACCLRIQTLRIPMLVFGNGLKDFSAIEL